ncbi:MAG: hypothetical protein U0174_26885 [Polyangiaceae bacterium]
MRVRFALVPAAALSTVAVAIVACATSTVSIPTDDGGSGNTEDAMTPTVDGGTTPDASKGDTKPAQTWCDALAAKQDRCDGTRECGTSFTSWCAAQSKTNSAAYEEGDAVCLGGLCDSKTRSDCRYKTYKEASLTASQKAFITAYCNTCSTPNCEASLRTYNAAKGPDGVSDAFVAAWEFSDAITDKIRTKCTGAALSIDGGSCEKAFGSCAADEYLNSLPDCP